LGFIRQELRQFKERLERRRQGGLKCPSGTVEKEEPPELLTEAASYIGRGEGSEQQEITPRKSNVWTKKREEGKEIYHLSEIREGGPGPPAGNEVGQIDGTLG